MEILCLSIMLIHSTGQEEPEVKIIKFYWVFHMLESQIFLRAQLSILSSHITNHLAKAWFFSPLITCHILVLVHGGHIWRTPIAKPGAHLLLHSYVGLLVQKVHIIKRGRPQNLIVRFQHGATGSNLGWQWWKWLVPTDLRDWTLCGN